MKIVHIIGKMNKGGVEAVVSNYLRAIDDSELEFDVIYDADSSADAPQDLLEKGVSFIKVPPYQKVFSYVKAVKRICRQRGYDAVHVHMNTLSVFPLFAAWLAGVPHRICHNHSTTSRRETKRNILKMILRPFCPLFATEYAACGEMAARWMFGEKHYLDGKVTVFNNAVDIKKYAFDSSARSSVRARLGLEDCYVIGHVGRFVNVKNHGFLLGLFAEYLKVNDKAALLLVGDGELLEKIKERAHELGINEKVVIITDADCAAPYYSAMDVFCLPSLYEGLPVVAVEAQASGLFCLLSDKITDECKVSDRLDFLSIENGFEPWLGALSGVRCTDRGKYASLLEMSKFSINRSSSDMVAFYKKLAEKNSSGSEARS